MQYTPHTVWVDIPKPMRAQPGMTLRRVVEYLSTHGRATAKQIAQALRLSQCRIRRLMNELIGEPKPVVRVVPTDKPTSQHNPNQYEICS